MRLYNVHTLKEAEAVFKNNFNFETEYIHIDQAYNRIIAEDIIAEINVPSFRRSTVDGYAVVSSDTNGASDTMPMLLENHGSIEMGESARKSLGANQAIYVPTGGMIPDGADAMVMIEYTERFSQDTIGILKQALPLAHIVSIGSDVKKGESVLKMGQVLAPRHIGVLAAVGVFKIKVYKIVTACVISTGDELVTNNKPLLQGQVYDINTYTLTNKLKSLGVDVVESLVLKDERDLIKETIKNSNEKYDVTIISGGSSVGEKDYTADLIDELSPEDGVLIHGLAIKPGKPTIVGKVSEKLVLGLPGHPVSALIVLDQMIRMYLSNMTPIKVHTKEMILSKNVHAAPGKETFVMVMVDEEFARPVLGKSGMISMMSKAHGYIRITEDLEGIDEGELVTVYLLD